MNTPTVYPSAPVLRALRTSDPPRWRLLVRAALEASQGSVGAVQRAAKLLGVGHATVGGWLTQDPSLRDGLNLPAAGRPRAGGKRTSLADYLPAWQAAHGPKSRARVIAAARREGNPEVAEYLSAGGKQE